MNLISAYRHFRTITRHRHMVIIHCARCGIFFQGLGHDLSKYLPIEFVPGAKYYQGTRSPNEMERETNGFSRAWMHHKGHNKHHFEYWTDYNCVTKQVEPVPMDENYIIEMFCDRIAASKVYNGKKYTDRDTLNYFLRGRGRHLMHAQTAAKLEFLLDMLAEKGEKATFDFVRSVHKSGGSLPLKEY